jgi:hypothetical protein
MVMRLSLSMVRRYVVAVIATITIPQLEVKIFTQYQSPTMRVIAWKTLDAKSYTEMKQSP